MNYTDEKVADALSSEYVLGTLVGKARIRYQRLVIKHDKMRQRLWAWERHLNDLGGSLPEQTPDARVWQGIQVRLGFVEPVVIPSITSDVTPVEIKTRRTQWKTAFVSGMAVAASLLFITILLWPGIYTDSKTSKQIAIVQNADAQALWLIDVRDDMLFVKSSNKLTLHTDKDYELWMVAKDGRAPISLGILPKTGTLTIPRPEVFDHIDIAALAVSLEPLGGSPTGQPTTVLYTTELMSI